MLVGRCINMSDQIKQYLDSLSNSDVLHNLSESTIELAISQKVAKNQVPHAEWFFAKMAYAQEAAKRGLKVAK